MTRRRPRLLALAAALVATGGGAAYAAAASVTSGRLTTWSEAATCTPSTTTVQATADTHVDQDSPGSNFGSSSVLRVHAPLVSALGIDLGGRGRTLVRFVLPNVGLCSVTQARLRLNASSATGGRTLEALRLAAAWTEGGVTWNTQPATTGSAVSTTSGTGWREWTVTSHVQSMYSSGSNEGWLIRDTAGALLLSAQQFSSRAGADPPELVVTLG